MVDNNTSGQTIRELIEETPIIEKVRMIKRLDGTEEKLTDLLLYVKFGIAHILTEEADKADIKKYAVDMMKRKLEEYIMSLTMNQIYSESSFGGIHVNVHADKPLLVMHPEHLSDILRNGCWALVVDYDTSNTKEIKD